MVIDMRLPGLLLLFRNVTPAELPGHLREFLDDLSTNRPSVRGRCQPVRHSFGKADDVFPADFMSDDLVVTFHPGELP